ncbi:hypothetical protein JL720_1482 [Aureococcus anophagefferens]|nr:hypothetical protein JL720_1482 [Aureococcus anophagefferens]
MRRSVGLLAVAASVAAAPRPSPNSSGPYFVRRWTWPAAQRGRGAFLSASDFVVNGTVDGCDATSVVCAATPKNAPARLSGTHWQHAQQAGAVPFAGYATDDPEGDRPGNRNQKGRYWFNRKFKYRKTDANPAVVADALPALADARRACLADLDGG